MGEARVGPFDPPYTLGGSMAVVLGTWDADPPLPDPAALHGYRPVRLFGRPLAVVVASDFQRPPPELPIRYHEVIAAVLLRRGWRLASLPVWMWLDDPVPVELGHRHYSMPKQLDPRLRMQLSADALRIDGAPSLRGRARARVLRWLLLPLSLLFGLGLWAFTHLTPVIGLADTPPRQARVAVTPGGVGRPLSLSRALLGGIGLRALWCQRYAMCETRLGPPEPPWPTEAP